MSGCSPTHEDNIPNVNYYDPYCNPYTDVYDREMYKKYGHPGDNDIWW
jgi:hypothetical protein